PRPRSGFLFLRRFSPTFPGVPHAVGSVTKRLLSSTASKAHGSSSWHGMDCEFAHRLHLLEDRVTSLPLVSCTHRCSGQGCTETFLLRFRERMWAHTAQGEVLAECCMKTEEETLEEILAWGYLLLGQPYPDAQLEAGPGMEPQDRAEVFLEC